jgi:hypothetical protein
MSIIKIERIVSKQNNRQPKTTRSFYTARAHNTKQPWSPETIRIKKKKKGPLPAQGLKDAGICALFVLEREKHFFWRSRLGTLLEADGVHVLGGHPAEDHPDKHKTPMK